MHDANRIFAFQRWVPGEGRDVVVVVSLNETSFSDGSYWLGFPDAGPWREVFNSDVYDHFVSPSVQGNAGGVVAVPEPLHGMPASAGVTIPANSILIFAR